MFTTAIVIDDDRASAAATGKLLSKAGCKVSIFTAADEALCKALAADVELVALDLAMPDVDGFELLTLIRSHEHSRRAPSVPVIAVTGKVMPDDRAATLAAGFAAHIGKPVLFEELKRCLATIFALRCALYRTRYSIDKAAILGRLAMLLTGSSGDRMLGVAALSMKLEQQAKEDLSRMLLDAHRGAVDAASEHVATLIELAAPLGAAHLVELCRSLQNALTAGAAAFEPAAVMVRAEIDRVIFTLREQALLQA